MNRNGDSESDETDPVPHPLSPDTDDNVGRNLNVFNTSNSFFNVKNARTPRTVRQNLTDKRPLRLVSLMNSFLFCFYEVHMIKNSYFSLDRKHDRVQSA